MNDNKQHQGEPVAWRVAISGNWQVFSSIQEAEQELADWLSLYSPEEIAEVHADGLCNPQPLYTHADPGEVERLHAELREQHKRFKAVGILCDDTLDKYGKLQAQMEEQTKQNAFHIKRRMEMAEQKKELHQQIETLRAQLAKLTELRDSVIAMRKLSEEIRLKGTPPHTDFWHQSIYEAEGRITTALLAASNPDGPRYCGKMKAILAKGVYGQCGKVRLGNPNVTQQCPDCAALSASAPLCTPAADDREAFEREAMRIAVRSFGYRDGEALLKTVLERRGNGSYCVEWVNGALEGWNARAALERKP